MKTVVAILLAATLTRSDAPDRPADSPPTSSLYARVESRLSRQPALAEVFRGAPPELAEVQWLAGRWSVSSRVFAESDEFTSRGTSSVEPILGGTWLQIRDSYEGETQDLGFFSFNPATKEWVAIGIDRTGNAITSKATRWEGNRLVLVAGEVQIVGERVVLRQTMTKVSEREYRILNEEQLENGAWARIDEYVYSKLDPARD